MGILSGRPELTWAAWLGQAENVSGEWQLFLNNVPQFVSNLNIPIRQGQKIYCQMATLGNSFVQILVEPSADNIIARLVQK